LYLRLSSNNNNNNNNNNDNNNKPVGDWTPRLAQISLPWQQVAAAQHFAWFH